MNFHTFKARRAAEGPEGLGATGGHPNASLTPAGPGPGPAGQMGLGSVREAPAWLPHRLCPAGDAAALCPCGAGTPQPR